MIIAFTSKHSSNYFSLINFSVCDIITFSIYLDEFNVFCKIC